MDKIQQFFIVKINSNRLKEAKFKIKNLTLDQARLNGEVVSLANSQMIRTIQKITNRKFSQYELNNLLEEKKKLSRQKNKKENRNKISELSKKIDELLYIPQIISIYFEDKRHFNNILDRDGFFVNGIRYVPFMASAGMLRRDTYLFIDSAIKEEIVTIFENGRDTSIEFSPAKFSAYYSLYSSSTIPVSFPKMVVISDLIIKTIRKVDYSTYMGIGVDPKIEEIEKEIECNAFDGEGLCTPKLARKWAKELGMDYTPSIFGIRAPYMKGMLCVFDIHDFADKIAKTDVIKDIYGNDINIKDVECIISESQFKLFQSYKSTNDYISKCKENDLGFGITKVNPKEEKNHARTSYQFLQVLSLDDEQIESLCKPTLDWLRYVSGGNVQSSLLYSLGETDYSKGWFDRLDNTTQAILLDNSIINDSYIQSSLNKSISKKKNDAKIGRLIFNGNYQVMISDPFVLAAHAFGMGVSPLLREGEHYSKYWNDRNIETVAAIRSPIVHSSEVNVLNFRNDDDTNYWYKHISSGIIYPAFGIGMDDSIEGGADHDLDLTCTIDSKEIIEGRQQGLPILYENKKAPKELVDVHNDGNIVASQINQIRSNKIGFLTNVSSTLYSVLSNFEQGSKEYEAISNRLKYGRVAQGLEIDRTKGLIIDKFPEHFVKWTRIKDDMTDDEKEYHNFNNSIVANHRPYFMRWLYSHFNRRYLKELSIYNNISQTKWGVAFEDLLESENMTLDQKDLIYKYKRKSFLINNDSTMNRISRYIDKQIKNIKGISSVQTKNFDYSVLLSKGFKTPIKRDIDKMKLLFKEWKSLNRNLRDKNNHFDSEETYQSFEQISSYINRKGLSAITSDSSELADIAIYTCYKVLGVQSKSFAWRCFGKQIVENIKSKKKEKFVRVPMLNKSGSDEYLWSRYGVYLLNLEDN